MLIEPRNAVPRAYDRYKFLKEHYKTGSKIEISYANDAKKSSFNMIGYVIKLEKDPTPTITLSNISPKKTKQKAKGEKRNKFRLEFIVGTTYIREIDLNYLINK